MTMQITTTNQKTKSIRPASRDAGVGSQGIRSATAAEITPAIVPITSKAKMEPLRIRRGA